ncbi:hypothetical protein [Streptomyces sp. DH12]|uniref:hypothetical protein n=1 Tax=Streptomyces sp. DH12 TaxID=2857010 RepID=UPI001E3F0E62|nr:hypothetical protein [Streptomyces sp. DH12]
MADRLYQRYMAASTAYRTHTRTCAECTTTSHCTTGEHLLRALAELQDAYTRQLRR